MTMFYIISGTTTLGIIYYISCYKSKEKKEINKIKKELLNNSSKICDNCRYFTTNRFDSCSGKCKDGTERRWLDKCEYFSYNDEVLEEIQERAEFIYHIKGGNLKDDKKI